MRCPGVRRAAALEAALLAASADTLTDTGPNAGVSMARESWRVVTSVLAAAAFAVSMAACDTQSSIGERRDLAHLVEAVPRPAGIVLTPCKQVSGFEVPDDAESLLASCFSTSEGGAGGDVRGFVDALVTAVGASVDPTWTCEMVGVGLVFCSAVVSRSGDGRSDVRFIVQLRSDATPADLPRSFEGEVGIAVAVVQAR